MTGLIDSFNTLGGKISDVDKAELERLEKAQQSSILKLKLLKKEGDTARAEKKDTAAFLADYADRELKLLKDADKIRESLSLNRHAQNLVAYAKEKESLALQLQEINTLFRLNDEERARATAKALSDSAKRVQTIVVGDSEDFDTQADEYAINLKKRESAHAAHIASISKLESEGGLTTEDAEAKKLASTLDFYRVSLSEAKKYLDQVNKLQHPDEYNKRYKIFLDAEKDFYEKSGKIATDSMENKRELSEKELENSSKIADALYDSARKKQKEATEVAKSAAKVALAEDIANIKAYYDEQRAITEQHAIADKKLIEKRISEVEQERDKKLEIENSLEGANKIKSDSAIEIIKLRTELNSVESDAIKIVNDLTSAEIKALDTAKNKADKLAEQIQIATDKSSLLGGSSLEDQFAVENRALEEKHRQQLKMMNDFSKDSVQIKRTELNQKLEMENIKAQQAKQLRERDRNQEIQLLGDTASMLDGLMKAGILRGKKAFEAYKAFSIAEAMIATYSSAVKAYDSALDMGGPMATVAAVIAAAAAVAQGLAKVAMISAQQPPGYAEGGRIKGYSPSSTADNITIQATADEFMQPVKAVKHYGLDVMEGIRRLAFPKEMFQGFKSFSPPRVSYALAAGGSVPSKNQPMSSNVSLVNNTGVPMVVESQTSTKDRGREIIEVVLGYASTNKGNFATALKSIVNGR